MQACYYSNNDTSLQEFYSSQESYPQRRKTNQVFTTGKMQQKDKNEEQIEDRELKWVNLKIKEKLIEWT